MATLEKILIIRFSSIGDIILASPLIRMLRTAYPQAQIDFLVKSEYVELIKHNQHLSSVIELRTTQREELHLLRQRIQKESYTAIFDIHNSLRSRHLRKFSGAKYVRVVKKHALARFLLVNLKKNFYPKNILPVAQRYLATATSFGIDDDGKGLEVFVPDDTVSSTAAMLSKYNLNQHHHIIGIVPSAKHFTKRWLPERFVEFGVKSTSGGQLKLLIFGGKDDVDYCGDIAQMINARVGRTTAESVAGKFSLLETAAAFDHCHVIVTNDTGLMHLAGARQRKVVAIFGSTVREFGFFPYGVENIVIERKGLDCRPCSHIGLQQCPQGHFRCMKDIHVDDVLNAAQSLLDSTPIEKITHNA